jgi:hypothetical protein
MDAVTAAQNQALFREVNERIRNFDYSLPPTEFVCECARTDCRRIVPMSLDEYEEIRRSPNLFLVAPGNAHVFRNLERLFQSWPRYWVVEKFGEAAIEATRLDPRSGERGRTGLPL